MWICGISEPFWGVQLSGEFVSGPTLLTRLLVMQLRTHNTPAKAEFQGCVGGSPGQAFDNTSLPFPDIALLYVALEVCVSIVEVSKAKNLQSNIKYLRRGH